LVPLTTIQILIWTHLIFKTTILNKHLQEIMEGLTAKVFRTYNASRTLEEQLNELTAGMWSLHNASTCVALVDPVSHLELCVIDFLLDHAIDPSK